MSTEKCEPETSDSHFYLLIKHLPISGRHRHTFDYIKSRGRNMTKSGQAATTMMSSHIASR